MKRDLLRINDLTGDELTGILDVALALKQWPGVLDTPPLAGMAAAMIFEKPSLRTRLSFELALLQLGAHVITLSGAEVGLGARESVPDASRALSSYVDAIVGRVFTHETLQTMARVASVPVINALSDQEHPCQALADILTLQERFGSVRGKTIAFIGDGNNVALSLTAACSKLGVNVCLASPVGYAMSDRAVSDADVDARASQSWLEVCHDPVAAVRNADAVYTDGWYSMGQESEAEQRREVFREFQVNKDLMSAAPAHAVTMHCLPAHRGEEITDEVLDSDQCLAFDQAHNRLFAQKSVLLWLLRPDTFEQVRSHRQGDTS